MMKTKKVLAVGIVALLIFGLILAANATVEKTHKRNMHDAPMIEELDLPEDATPKEVRDAILEKRLKELGLTEDSTIKELKEAREERMQTRWKEKLGLSEDASEEEITAALKEKREQCEECNHMKAYHNRKMMGVPGLMG